MSSRRGPDAARPRRGGFAILVICLLALLVPEPGRAQNGPGRAEGLYARIGPSVAGARVAIKAPETDPDALAGLRETLLGLRSQVGTVLAGAQEGLDAASAELNQLGPAPAEGTAEPEDLARQRETLAEAVAAARVPVLRAQKAQRDLDATIGALDAAVWKRASAQLLTRGPSPLLPPTWVRGVADLGQRTGAGLAQLEASWQDPPRRAAVRRTLPASMLLIILGIAIAISFRLRLTAWVEHMLSVVRSPRAIAWLVVVRNVSRLILPMVGAGLLVAAFDPARLTGADPSFRVILLPPFLLALIGAGWLGSSVYAPGLPDHRLPPLDDATARRASRTTLVLGIVLSIHLLLAAHVTVWALSPEATTVLYFPLFLIGGYGLWRLAVTQARIHEVAAGDQSTRPLAERPSVVGLGLMRFIETAFRLAAIAVPLFGATGYLAAARYLLFAMIETYALLGAGFVLFDLIQKTRFSLTGGVRAGGLRAGGARAGGADEDEGGLAPVVVVTLLLLAGAPVFALIWGARASDLGSFWLVLREGASIGGVRISLGAILTFVVVLGIGYGVVTLLQSVMRSSVLPRTRLDAGGRNAILSGIGYLGFGLALLIAVSSTGIDLSSLAIVAGALSVGIGFGLQNVVSNFVSGIILLIERPIKEGDWIEVGGFVGYVRRISVRSTELETFDRSSVIVPNSDLIAGTVLNRTHKTMIGRLTLPVGVAYGSDPRQVEAILREVAEGHPMALEDPPPSVLFMQFGASSLDFEIRCVLRDVNFVLSARSDMNFEIAERFRAAGIEIPFPQMDVHLRRSDGPEKAAGPVSPS